MSEKYSLRESVDRQISKVLARGQRFEAFNQIRQRHFWSSYLFAALPENLIPAGAYEIFKAIPGFQAQGYPVPLTIRETNWLGAGRVPDQQNFVINEIGVTLKRPPAAAQLINVGTEGQVSNLPGSPFWMAPSNSIAGAMSNTQAARINGLAPIHPADAQAILYGGVLEMGFLTNAVPLGLLADFSQSAGLTGMNATPYTARSYSMNPTDGSGTGEVNTPGYPAGDPTNGVPAAAFRRKLEIPILLQHGEQAFMRINFPKPVQCLPSTNNFGNQMGQGTGWYELRVDWWATESYAELS